MSRSRKPPQLCVYCTTREASTVDHVPPRSLFAPPRPKNLITVPACERCNKGFAKDDEYFRMILGMKRETAGHPAGRWLLESVNRSLVRPQGRGFALAVSRLVNDVAVHTPAGLYPGTVGGFAPDWQRLERFAERVVRGLYWKEQGHPLPLTHVLRAQNVKAPNDELRASMAEVFGAAEPREFGDGVFRYVFARTVRGGGTVWAMEFFHDVSFFALTADPVDEEYLAAMGRRDRT